ncbi:hypothetical protein CDES_07165 [Corynebacterium deserti GIMN1.010]|uniref:Nitrite/Sulfite reductase ferredoxin-like domain-containing protein n=1 Tax=Corynebacterium deserti GIMN1.010 TaxID=931089 RepID=A0A0M4CIE3_9CORY|nr:hypothetical protein [Corynebacterium deserti]ALC05846.1 hypothetical protein CDES_07165 [Corynebacterium deserti GIMN1.010]
MSTLIFHSADDDRAHVHVPAGRVAAPMWEEFADFAESQGDGALYLTNLCQVQFRGVANVEVSPRATVITTPGQFVELAGEVAGAVRQPATIGVDAGDGSILRPDMDVAFLLVDASFHLFLRGVATNVAVAIEDVVAVASELCAMDSPSVSSLGALCTPTQSPEVSESYRAPIGWLEHDGQVSLGAGLPDGRMESRLARFIAAINADVTITPWKTLIIHDLSDGVAEQVVKVLAPMGLIFDANSPLLEQQA